MVGLEPELDAADVEQALGEEPGGGEERHRQRDLRRGEGVPEARRGARARWLSGLTLERADEIRPCAVERGEQSEQHAGAGRQCRGEEHHAAVDREDDRVGRFLRQQHGHQVQRPLRDDDAGDAAEQREETGLAEQLPHELPAPRAYGQPHRHLAGTRRAAREQQVRDIRARDEQHERGDAEQQRERRLRFTRHAALAARSRFDYERLCLEARERLLAHPFLERRLDVVEDVSVRRADGGGRLRDGHARLQPGEEVRPVAAAVVEALEGL